MGELRASLYDVFGYFLPGLIATAGLRLLFWVCFYSKVHLSLLPLGETTCLAAIAVVAYLVGHLLHAIGNEIPFTRSSSLQIPTPKPKGWRLIFARSQVSTEVIKLTEDSIKAKFGADFCLLNHNEKLELIDEARLLHGRDNEREVYVYREGFYRGMTVACAILCIGLAASLTTNQLVLTDKTSAYTILWSERGILLLFTIIAVFLFWKRMHRFSYYKVSRSIMLWLVISNSKQTQIDNAE